MNILKNIGSYLFIGLLGLLAYFSQRAKAAHFKAQLAKEEADINREYNATLKRINKNRAQVERKHAQEIKQEQHKRRSSDRDQLSDNW